MGGGNRHGCRHVDSGGTRRSRQDGCCGSWRGVDTISRRAGPLTPCAARSPECSEPWRAERRRHGVQLRRVGSTRACASGPDTSREAGGDRSLAGSWRGSLRATACASPASNVVSIHFATRQGSRRPPGDHPTPLFTLSQAGPLGALHRPRRLATSAGWGTGARGRAPSLSLRPPRGWQPAGSVGNTAQGTGDKVGPSEPTRQPASDFLPDHLEEDLSVSVPSDPEDPAFASSQPPGNLSRRAFLGLLSALGTGVLGGTHLASLAARPADAAPPNRSPARSSGQGTPSVPPPPKRPAEDEHVPMAGKPVAPTSRPPTPRPGISPSCAAPGPPPREGDRPRFPGEMEMPVHSKRRSAKPSKPPKR